MIDWFWDQYAVYGPIVYIPLAVALLIAWLMFRRLLGCLILILFVTLALVLGLAYSNEGLLTQLFQIIESYFEKEEKAVSNIRLPKELVRSYEELAHDLDVDRTTVEQLLYQLDDQHEKLKLLIRETKSASGEK